MRTYNEGIEKGRHDSDVILSGVLKDCLNLEMPAGFLKASQILSVFRERMDVWARFEKGEVENDRS